MVIEMAKNPMDKVLRPFALKSIQIILQSRLGKSINTPCKPESAEPFGITIDDIPEISQEVKTVLSDGFRDRSLYVEISLGFADNEDVTLENWILVAEPEDAAAKKSPQELYTIMSSMLKSLITITRMLPAHKMTKNLEGDSCKVRYRIYLGNPNAVDLGADCKTLRFNRFDCGSGTAHMAVSYRTSIIKNWCNSRILSRSSVVVDLNEPLKLGAFVNESIKPYCNRELDDKYRDLNWLVKFAESPGTSTPLEDNREKTEDAAETEPEMKLKSIWMPEREYDKFKKELNLAFATPTALGELATFYRSFNDAPTLEQCKDLGNVSDVSEQLKKHEKKIIDYEQLIAEL